MIVSGGDDSTLDESSQDLSHQSLDESSQEAPAESQESKVEEPQEVVSEEKVFLIHVFDKLRPLKL